MLFAALAPAVVDAQTGSLTLAATSATEKSAIAPATVSFSFKVTSTQPLPANVEFLVDRLPGGWHAAFTPAVAEVAPGATVSVGVAVTVPSNATPQRLAFAVYGRDATTRLAATNLLHYNVTLTPPPSSGGSGSGTTTPDPATFYLAVRDATVRAAPGATVTNALTITSVRDTNGLLVRARAQQPPGWPAGAIDFDRTVRVYQSIPADLAFEIRVPDSFAPGSEHTVTLVATSADVPDLVREVAFKLVVDDPPARQVSPPPPTPAPEPEPDPAPASGEPPAKGGSDASAPGTATTTPVPDPEPAAVAPAIALRLAEKRLEVAPGEWVTSAVEVTNAGDASQTLRLAADLTDGFVVKFQAGDVVAVPPGGAVTVLFSVQAPPGAKPGGLAQGAILAASASEPFLVAIVPPGEPVQEAVVQETTPAPQMPSPLGRLVATYGVAPLAAAAGAVAAGGAAIWLAGAPNARRHLWWLGLGMYTRLTRPKLLDHPERERLFQTIEQQPGIHFHALQRELGWNTGALTYHLRVLERHQLVVSRRDGILRRFYLVGQAPRVMPVTTAPVTGAQVSLSGLRGNVLSTVRERGSIAQSALAEELGASKQTLNYHVKTLERLGLLRVERVGRDTFLSATAGADEGLGPHGTGAATPAFVVGEAGFHRSDDLR